MNIKKKKLIYRELNLYKIDGKKMKGNKKNMYGIGIKEIQIGFECFYLLMRGEIERQICFFLYEFFR